MTPHKLTATVASAPAKIKEVIEREAYTIEEFCRSHAISRGTFFNMRATGTGPREKRAMGRVLITKDSAREWRERVTL